MTKKALLTGTTGQDASHLADFLLEKGYNVYGLVRRTSTPNKERITHILDKIILVNGDLTDQASLDNIMKEIQPDEIYHLGAQSHVGESWKSPISTFDINALGTMRMLEAMRRFCPNARFYNAASSEMFGKVREVPQKETTPFYSRSPYGASKIAAFELTRVYRESYGLFACSGILFNHEGERRGLEFVTRKITDGVAKIKWGLSTELVLGNLESKRDWGYSPDYCKAMWLMLQQESPDDYVVATGETHTIGEFVREAFRVAGINDWEKYVRQDEKFMRPAEVDLLIGDYSKAKEKLGWEPTIRFKELVKMMVGADIERLRPK